MNYNNILLITDNKDIQKLVSRKLILLRENDKISISTFKEAKKNIENSNHSVIIIHNDRDDNSILKLIKFIKETKKASEIILLCENAIIKYAKIIVIDYITLDDEDCQISIKIVNCFKSYEIKEENARNKTFLSLLNILDPKNGLYKYQHLKELFNEISDDSRIKSGIFCILTLAERIKTKVSTNRLALTLKNNTRSNDIVASARGGYFYIIFQMFFNPKHILFTRFFNYSYP